MAHLKVERKPGKTGWLWVLNIAVIIALASTLYNRYGGSFMEHPQQTTSTTY